MVTRLANANEAGARHLARLGGLSEEEGRIAWRVYCHIGLARADAVTGQPDNRHGAYLDREPIRNAVANADELLALRPTPWRKRR